MTRPGLIRAFLALEMPGEVREAIRREQGRLKKELPRARWTRPEGQHLTLKFLGETPEADLRALGSSVAGSTAELDAVAVELRGSGFFPNERRPRVAWVGGSAGGGAEVAAAVERAAVEAGFPPERRPWSLHLTQARIDRPWPRSAVERFLDWGRMLDLTPFDCREIVLFRSDLRPGGAVYTALERFPLR
jgi:2'-5' RNA ligase